MSRRSFLVLLLLAAQLQFPLWGQPRAKALQQLDAWFFAANDAYSKGKFQEAARLYRLSIKNGERELFSWFNLGNTMVQLQRPDLAVVAYRRTVELSPLFTRAWVQLGDLLFLNNAHPEAVVAYRRALELEGANEGHIRHALGEIALANGEWTTAQRELEQALALEPDRVELWIALAAAYEGLSDWEGAEERLREALERAPSAGAEIWFQLALLREKQGDRLQMRRALEEGLSLEPGQTPFRRWLSRCWIDEGSPWMAIFVLEEGLARSEEPDLRLDLANLLFELGRYDESLLHYRKLAEKGDPLGRAGVENIANSYWNSGDTVRAAETRKQ